MRKPLFGLGLLAAAVIAAGSGRAEDPPHLELVRNLRTSGMPDLALEYLQRLKAAPPKGVEAMLPLEFARTRLELAELESEDAKRTALRKLARGEFEAFVKANPGSPQAAQATLEIARLIAAQGRQQLARARRFRDKEQMESEVAKASPYFADAAKRITEAIGLIDEQLKKLPEGDTATRAELTQARMRAELEEAVNLFNQGLRIVADDKRLERGKVIDQAKAKLEKLSVRDDTSPICWVAKVWISQCDKENDRRDDADRRLKAVLDERSPAAEAAQRLAKYFKMLRDAEAGAADRWVVLAKDARAWLRAYGGYANTPEGQGVRYYLALSLHRQAEPLIQRDAKTRKPTGVGGTGKNLLTEAAAWYKGLTETDNEFTDRAVRNRMQIILVLAVTEGGGEIDPARVRTFETAYLGAQVELAKLNALLNPEPPDAKEKSTPVKLTAADAAKAQAAAYDKVIALLTRGLKVVTPKDPPKDVFDARSLLTYAHLTTKDYLSAAVLGEHIARTSPSVGQAAGVGLYAVQAYANSTFLQRQAAAKGLDGADDEAQKQFQAAMAAGIDADQKRLIKLAQYIDQTWPDEPATDAARYQLGRALWRGEKNYPEACKVLAKVGPDYSYFYRARAEEGAAAFYLQRADNFPAAVKADCLRRAIADLRNLPPAEPEADLDEAVGYVQARLQLAQLLQVEGKSPEQVTAVARSLADLLPKFTALKGPEASEQAEELRAAVRTMEVFGVHAQAGAEYNAGNHAKVAELVKPVVERIRAEQAKPPTGDGAPAGDARLLKAQQNLLLLALRSSVQDGKIDDARKLLDVLQKGSGGLADMAEQLRPLVSGIRGQIEKARREKDTARADKLSQGFGSFLDDLAKQDKLPTPMRLFLAAGYSGLDKHVKAIELLKGVPEPTEAELLKRLPDPRDPKKIHMAHLSRDSEVQSFRASQFLMAQAYRENKQFDEARKLLVQILGSPANQILGEKPPPKGTEPEPAGIGRNWAGRMLDVKKEAILLTEDQGRWKEAIAGWQALMRTVRAVAEPKTEQERRDRDAYYDLYFNSQRCLVKAFNVLTKDPAQRKEKFKTIAKNVVAFEGNNGVAESPVRKEFVELIEGDALLKEAYKEAGGKLFLAEDKPARAAAK